MKLLTILIILVIITILFSKIVENFVLTNTLPTGLSVTLTKGPQTITATTGSAFTTDASTLDPNFYYAVGTLNDTGKQAVSNANALVKNNGTTCSSFPDKFYIKLPATDAVCKTTDADLYNYSVDSFSVCNKNVGGILYKQGTLKTPDTTITLQDSYNGGKTCTQLLPATKDIACSGIDAICKTADIDLYDVPADSNTVCTILEGGVWKKQGTLKSDASITVTAKYGTGITCVQQLPATKNITCGAINAVCPINDNSFYTFGTTVIKGSSIISPNIASIISITSKMSETTDPGLFDAIIKVNVPSSYVSLGIRSYKVKVIDTFNNIQVNSTNNVLIDGNNNLTVKITHERPVSSSNYLYLGQDYEAVSRAMIQDRFNFDGTYNVTISSVDANGVIGPESVPVTFNSGFPPTSTIQALLNTVNDV